MYAATPVLAHEQLTHIKPSGLFMTRIDLQSTVVTLPDYWRARIEANLDDPLELEPQVQVLLACAYTRRLLTY
jgi:hypothetical protein